MKALQMESFLRRMIDTYTNFNFLDGNLVIS